MRQVKVIVNDKTFDVELGDLTTSPIAVNVNGKSYSVEIQDESGSTSPAVSAPAQAVAVQAPAVTSRTAAVAPQATSSGNDVRSPMPGVVLDVVVKPGQKVSRGEQLCALDAMKMKNAIRAPHDAVIASVEITDGQKVAFGDVLVTFE
jgi:glutaconyl-CoA/methylmalonyl-CoA decarboxylase subunit gamma